MEATSTESTEISSTSDNHHSGSGAIYSSGTQVAATTWTSERNIEHSDWPSFAPNTGAHETLAGSEVATSNDLSRQASHSANEPSSHSQQDVSSFHEGSPHQVVPCRGAGTVACQGITVNQECVALQGAENVTCERSDYKSIAAGKRHTCVHYSLDGAVNCWGSDSLSQVRDTPATTDVRLLQAGGVATCILDAEGEPECWGAGNLLENVPTGPFSALTVGWDAACARDAGDFYTCWGDDSNYKLTARPDEPIVDLAIGWQQACAILEDHSITCWGANDQGQAAPPPGNDFHWLSLASWHGCAGKSDGTISCWGNVPSPPSGQVKTMSSRGLDSCAIMLNDTVKCWGRGAAREVPSLLARQIGTGDGHACAILLDGRITCWGDLP